MSRCLLLLISKCLVLILMFLFFVLLTRLCPVWLVKPLTASGLKSIYCLSCAVLLAHDFCLSSCVVNAVNLLCWMWSQLCELAWKLQPKIKEECWKTHLSTMQLIFLLIMKHSCVLGTSVSVGLKSLSGISNSFVFFLCNSESGSCLSLGLRCSEKRWFFSAHFEKLWLNLQCLLIRQMQH